MKIREALIIQSPSLALQRAAQDEIARLDLEIMSKDEEIQRLKLELAIVQVEYDNMRF